MMCGLIDDIGTERGDGFVCVFGGGAGAVSLALASFSQKVGPMELKCHGSH